jgi:hypothetical protein
LATPKTARQWETVVRKVQWSLCGQEELRKFDARLQADLLALEITLQRINISPIIAHTKQTKEAVNLV